MTNPVPRKISELPLLSALANNDFIPVVDVSDTSSNTSGETKRVTYLTLQTKIQNSIDTSFTETDPIFSAHVSSDITQTDIDQWAAAYGWGNHAVQGYLQGISAQSINALNDVDTTGVSTDDVLKWNGTSWVAGTGGGGTTINELNDVGDVSISSVATGQVLKYNGTNWVNAAESSGGIDLDDLSVTSDSASGGGSLSYNNGSGVFTFRPANLSSYLENVSEDSFPALGGNLSLNNNNIWGTGNIDITGDVKGQGLKLTQNNSSINTTTGTSGEIRRIGGAPYYFDGTKWREFFLYDSSQTTQDADTDWDDVLIRSTFDSNINDVRYNVTPTVSDSSVIAVGSPYKVGSGSLRLNGEYIEYPMRSEYSFTGAWTFEAWIYFDDLPAYDSDPFPLFTGNSSSTAKNWGLYVSRKSAGGNMMRFSWYNGNTQDKNNPYPNSSEGLLSTAYGGNSFLNAWNHIAISKDASDGTIRLFVNGQVAGSIVDNDINDPDEIRIGGSEYYGIESDIFVDDLRVTKDTRYSAAFTAPTSPLPVSGSTTTITPPPTEKQGFITLGSTPTWTGTTGVTPTRQSTGVYRLTFASGYSNVNDYMVIAQTMDQTNPSYVQAERNTSYVEFEVKTQSADAAVNNGAIAVQIINID